MFANPNIFHSDRNTPDSLKRLQTDKCGPTEELSKGYTNAGCFSCEQTTKFNEDVFFVLIF